MSLTASIDGTFKSKYIAIQVNIYIDGMAINKYLFLENNPTSKKYSVIDVQKSPMPILRTYTDYCPPMSFIITVGKCKLTLNPSKYCIFYKKEYVTVLNLKRNNTTVKFLESIKLDQFIQLNHDDAINAVLPSPLWTLSDTSAPVNVLSSSGEVINTISINTIRRLANTSIEANVASGETCAITMEPLTLQNAGMTNCGHIFNKNAIEKIIKNPNSKCPLCNYPKPIIIR